MSRLLPALLLASLVLAVLPLAGQDDKPKKNYAVLVGVNRYEHARLAQLKYAENDAAALADVLKRAGYEVTLLTGAAGGKNKKHAPTKANIEAHLKAVLKKCRPGDTVVVALAGHGLHFEGQDDSFFCPVEGLPFKDETATLVSLKGIYAEMDKSRAGVRLLLVDACRDDPAGGRGSRGADGDTAPRPPSGVGALFSCSKGQRAFEHDDFKHGVFFHYVLDGLRGKAKNEDGEVTWNRLVEHVSRMVTRDVPKRIGGGAQQTPHLQADIKGAPPVLLTVEEDGDGKSFGNKDGKWFRNKVGMKMVRIRAGKFLMGSDKAEKGRHADEGPRHEVRITREFYMAAHPVMLRQFRRFVAAERYKTDAERDGKGGWGYNADTKKLEGRRPMYTWRNPGWEQTRRHPVVNVSFNDAVAYCTWLSKLEGKAYRLPTEAEWEYACRGGTSTRFYYGDDNNDLQGHANLADVSLRLKVPAHKRGVDWDDGHPFTAPVGSFKANPWGLFDMHGNVWQWCRDCYDEEFYKDRPEEDPECTKGERRVLRGGSWSTGARFCRAANRRSLVPTERGAAIGFRVVFAPAGGTP
jgi:formylglycine-generating enzyme required for sulfatase activity